MSERWGRQSNRVKAGPRGHLWSAGGLAGGHEGGFVVGLAGDLLDVLDVLDLAVLADDEHRARGEALERAVADEDAVGPADRAVAEVGQRLDPAHPGGA